MVVPFYFFFRHMNVHAPRCCFCTSGYDPREVFRSLTADGIRRGCRSLRPNEVFQIFRAPKEVVVSF